MVPPPALAQPVLCVYIVQCKSQQHDVKDVKLVAQVHLASPAVKKSIIQALALRRSQLRQGNKMALQHYLFIRAPGADPETTQCSHEFKTAGVRGLDVWAQLQDCKSLTPDDEKNMLELWAICEWLRQRAAKYSKRKSEKRNGHKGESKNAKRKAEKGNGGKGDASDEGSDNAAVPYEGCLSTSSVSGLLSLFFSDVKDPIGPEEMAEFLKEFRFVFQPKGIQDMKRDIVAKLKVHDVLK